MGMALNADSTIAELLREKPESAQVLFRFGMGCLGCAIANSETIREAAQVHGIPLGELLSALGVLPRPESRQKSLQPIPEALELSKGCLGISFHIICNFREMQERTSGTTPDLAAA